MTYLLHIKSFVFIIFTNIVQYYRSQFFIIIFCNFSRNFLVIIINLYGTRYRMNLHCRLFFRCNVLIILFGHFFFEGFFSSAMLLRFGNNTLQLFFRQGTGFPRITRGRLFRKLVQKFLIFVYKFIGSKRFTHPPFCFMQSLGNFRLRHPQIYQFCNIRFTLP